MKPKLDKCVFYFSQEAHGNSVNEYEYIEIIGDSSLGIDNDKGMYFTIKTDEWSVENENDFKEIFDRISKLILPQ